ncbi:hypothetical protein BDV10DRAFT_17106 [Aspergillus recurvatus]
MDCESVSDNVTAAVRSSSPNLARSVGIREIAANNHGSFVAPSPCGSSKIGQFDKPLGQGLPRPPTGFKRYLTARDRAYLLHNSLCLSALIAVLGLSLHYARSRYEGRW